MWDLIVSVPDHCLSFYFSFEKLQTNKYTSFIASISKYQKHFKSICGNKKSNLKRLRKQNLINSRKSPKQFWGNIKGNSGYKNNSDKIPPQE